MPLGGLFNIEIESPKKTHLYAWGASKFDMKYVKLVFSPLTLASKSRTIELYDTLCICHHDHFHSESKDPMISVIQLSPAIVVQDGRTMFEKNWKITDLSRQNVEPTSLPVLSPREEEIMENGVVSDDEPVLITTAWTDENEKHVKESEDENISIKLNVANIVQNKEVNIKLKHEDSETGDTTYSIVKGTVNADGTITLKKQEND